MQARRLQLLAIALPVLLGWVAGQASRRGEPALPDDIGFVAVATPYDLRSGIAPDAPRAPDWAAQRIFADGDAYCFDSPLSLVIYLRNLPRYAPGRQTDDIAATSVRITGDGRWLAAEQALYVRGSSVAGPMRRGNLPACPDLAGAQDFIARHGGTVVHLADITAQLLQALEPARRHGAADHA
ncbi:nitrous oxide reductase accessory protein NosL [Ralstonia pseudosolanacearum]|uniref:nitrous oxide reductase accessory protein NosL n=1 Tax=Ralstonia pseudosolanacearum TaxID=1310165 RepID=UPI001C8BF06C|nr:nitrous oxide reductase accessory protein NosL [Ralstonia pseudosolanacearum]MBX9429637.1 nitrous oxide reductase accessory protein NosL [Ralstonia pseudosolanacearum]